MTKEELSVFRRMLLDRRKILLGDVTSLSEQALKRGDESSHLPVHMADVGTDTFEQDFALGIVENEEEEIREIDDAIFRIDEDKFGQCESCSELIPVPRLEAIPYTRLCMECKQREEEESS